MNAGKGAGARGGRMERIGRQGHGNPGPEGPSPRVASLRRVIWIQWAGPCGPPDRNSTRGLSALSGGIGPRGFRSFEGSPSMGLSRLAGLHGPCAIFARRQAAPTNRWHAPRASAPALRRISTPLPGDAASATTTFDARTPTRGRAARSPAASVATRPGGGRIPRSDRDSPVTGPRVSMWAHPGVRVARPPRLNSSAICWEGGRPLWDSPEAAWPRRPGLPPPWRAGGGRSDRRSLPAS